MPLHGLLSILFFVHVLAIAGDGGGPSGQIGQRPQERNEPALGYQPLPYGAPVAGSYALPALGMAVDGDVIDSEGAELRLHRLLGDKLVLLSFIYSTCSDLNGCPLATAVLHKVQRRLQASPELSSQLRLLTLSFNPEHDTPETLRQYVQQFQHAGVEWRFLTARSEREIAPILAGYHQIAEKDYGEQGQSLGTFTHVLRVYLIDRQLRIRNIYTVSFLHPDLLISDIKTLLAENGTFAGAAAPPEIGSGQHRRSAHLAETQRLKSAASTATAASVRSIFGDGDDKTGYGRTDYATRSLALADRAGRSVDLLKRARKPPLGLPPLPVPKDNPLSRDKIVLGRKLFYDRRLSLNNTLSCAMCHIPEQGFTSHEQATAVGVEGRSVRRNAPTLYNVGYWQRLFHDAREYRLEQQAWGPLLAINEMAVPSVGWLIEKIRGMADYHGLFEKAFGRGPTMETLGMALASYQRTLVAANSPFDRWYYGKQKDALADAAKRGFALFTGKAGCASCHSIGEKYALFTDQDLHDTGLGFTASMQQEPSKRRVQTAPGHYIEVDAAAVAAVSEPKAGDLGLYEITLNPNDRWKYKTPTLRNIALTAPYMHNGTLATLEEVVDYYDRGGIAHENLDSRIKPLELSQTEKEGLVEFLKALTGDGIEQLVLDAFAAPVGDAR